MKLVFYRQVCSSKCMDIDRSSDVEKFVLDVAYTAERVLRAWNLSAVFFCFVHQSAQKSTSQRTTTSIWIFICLA